MMRFLCDRCGKEIYPYSGMKVKWERGVLQLEFKPYNGEEEGDYDLCNKCSSEFKGWIDNAKNMDRNEAAGAE